MIPYRYLVSDRDRHGNTRIYFRRGGVKTRIRETPGTPEFVARYQDLVSGASAAVPHARADVSGDTLAALVRRYDMSAEFRALDPSTQRTRRRLYGHILAEPVRPDTPELFRDFPLARLRTSALEVLRDRKAGKPGAANDRVKALRALFRWAHGKRIIQSDPAAALQKIRVASNGWHTWTTDDIAAFEARHPVGTMANLAMRLMLYTGARRSDACRLGRQHYRDGELRWTAYKNRNRHPVAMCVPVLPALAEALAATPTGAMVFLASADGQPFSIAGFGNWFRERCDEAGLGACSAHGLRKAGSTLAAEEGASAHQLMAMFGWRSLAEAERYTRAAERRRLAADGMALVSRGIERAAHATVPPPRPDAASGTKSKIS